MLCLKKRRTYSFTQGACDDIPRRSKKDKNDVCNEALNIAVTTLPRKHHRSREERSSGVSMVLTVTEDTPADMLAGSMELLVQLPRDHNVHTQRVTVPRSTPMMDLLVQIATAHKLSASSYTLQAIGERGLVLPHQPNTPIGALDALQVKILPKQGTFLSRKAKQANQPFETTFRLQVLLPRNQLYVSRVSPKMNLGKILEEVCQEKNLDKNKYELRHPANLEETLDLSLSLQDYHLQEVTLYAKQGRSLGAALSSQDIMALQRQEERRRQHAKQSVFGFMFRKSKESSLSIDSLGGRSVSPARSDETGRSVSPLAPPSRPQRKRRPAPKPPIQQRSINDDEESNEKLVISHSRNSSDSSGYHEASVLSDNPDSNARMPETLPRRSKPPCKLETSRKLAQTSQASKSLGNLANLAASGGGLSHGISSTSISSTGVRKKRVAPPPPIARPLSSSISTQALERIVDSEESLTSDIDISKSPSDIAASSKANSDIGVNSKANSDIGVHSMGSKPSSEIGFKIDAEFRAALADHDDNKSIDTERRSAPLPPPARFKPSLEIQASVIEPESRIFVSSSNEPENVENARVVKRATGILVPTPKPRSAVVPCETWLPVAPRRKILKTIINDPTPDESFDNNNDEIHGENDKTENMEKNDDAVFTDVTELREKKDTGRFHNSEKGKMPKTSSMMNIDKVNIDVKKHALKHVKSMDDIYGIALKFTDKEIAENADSLSGCLSCAVISTIPKCARLSTSNILDNVEIARTKNSTNNVKSNLFDKIITKHEVEFFKKNVQTPKRAKIFRSQSSPMNDFYVNSFEKHARYSTSHPQDFTCALNPNFSQSIVNLETREINDDETLKMEICQLHEQLKIKPENIVNNFPPFVVQSTNLRCEKKANWEQPQLIGDSVSGDRTTETDILLQKVSDTLSNSLPISKPNVETIVPVPEHEITELFSESDEFDGIRETMKIHGKTNDPKASKEIETKNRESLLLIKSNLVNASISPNATINSQQDTSDYVSATGDDLSITDWEYQLPAPPSAFRDNISPEFDGYDTITLRSVEAFKEPVVHEEKSSTVDQTTSESPIPSPSIPKEIEQVSRSVEIPQTKIDQAERPFHTDEPRLFNYSQISYESQASEVSLELKKEIITELSTKIENGSLTQSNGKFFEQDSRRTTAGFDAPKIAPADNTLSNFTITTYSRQKSLNIFEEEPAVERRTVSELKNSEDRSRTLSTTLPIGKTSQHTRDNNCSSRYILDSVEDDISGQIKSVFKRAQNVEEDILIEPVRESTKSEKKFHFSKHDSLLRSPSLSNGHEKSAMVHRSKSYLTLANNSKYREDANFERLKNENDDARIMKSTSVTNLYQETLRKNEKFSQWRENMLKRQEEPSKVKQLQSMQVLKSILPQLKSSQQTEEDVTDSLNVREQCSDGSEIVPEAGSNELKSKDSETRAESPMIGRTEAEAKAPQTPTDETTTKRYKYTGPPAISLGSWSERPRVNVQLKMDTDYKFGPNNNNNISGTKTFVNLNGTSGERNDDKQNTMKSLPKNIAKNWISRDVDGTHKETLQERRDSEEDLAKKLITHTTAIGFKKSTFNKISQPEMKGNEVSSVALKKTYIERSDSSVSDRQREADDDDVKIDTKPVNFKELTKTFSQEVCLRANPQQILLNRHSDIYCGTGSDIAKTFSNGRTNFWDNKPTRNIETNKNSASSNETSREADNAPNRRYTSIAGIQSKCNKQSTMQNGESSMMSHTTNTRMNGLMPVVKGFKMQRSQNETKLSNLPTTRNGISTVDSFKKISNVPPPPPTMPIITGVTLKNNTTRPKSMPICNVDPRSELLESIRSFGGRDRLKNVNILS